MVVILYKLTVAYLDEMTVMTPSPLKKSLLITLSSIMLANSFSLLAGAEYYVLKSRGKSVGTVSVQQFERAGEHITEVENRNRYTRLGEPFEQVTTSRFVEHGGQPVSFTHEFRIADQQASYAEGEITPDELRLADQRADLQADKFYFPTGERLDAVFKAHYNDPPGTQFDYQTLHLALGPQLVNTEVTVLEAELAPPAEAADSVSLTRFSVRNPDADEPAVVEWRNPQGKLVRALSAELGTELVYAGEQIAQASREPLSGTARIDTVNATDVITSTRVVTNPIDLPRQTYDATYRLTQYNQGAGNLAYAIPQDERQSVVKADNESVELHVKQYKPDKTGVGYPIHHNVDFLTANAYIQSSDPQIASLAKALVKEEKRAYYAVKGLHAWVYENIRNKTMSMGFASASETLARREGDCTEHAVLLAAMARSVGIPARVAVGLTYLPTENNESGTFTYHMWTETYIGDDKGGSWIAVDATNPEFLADATHIKIADSPLRSGSDLVAISQKMAPLLGELNIRTLEAVAHGASQIDLSNRGDDLTVDLKSGGVRKLDLSAPEVLATTNASIGNYQFNPPPAQLGQDTYQGLLTRAIEALNAGQYDLAVSRIRGASEKLSGPMDHYRLGERLTGLEMYRLAYAEFEQAIAQDRSMSIAVNQWLDAYFPRVMLKEPVEREFFQAVGEENKGNIEAARAGFKAVLAEAPQFAGAYVHLARIARRQGDMDGAIASYEQALNVTPMNVQAYAELGDAYLEAEQYSQAMDRYRKAKGMLDLQTPDQTRRLAEEMGTRYRLAKAAWDIKRNRNNGAAWAEMGKSLYALKRPDDALDAFHNALVASPGNSEARAGQFQLMMDRNDWESLHALYPKYSGTLTQTAMGLRVKSAYEMAERNYDQSLQSAQRAIASAPGDADNYVQALRVYDHLKILRPKQAEQYETQAIRMLKAGVARTETDKPRIQYELARRQIEQGKTVEAASTIQDMLVEDPMNPLGHQLKGLKHFYDGEWAEAIGGFNDALALDPANEQTLIWIGHAYREDAQINKAYESYQAALALNPNNNILAGQVSGLIGDYKLGAKKPKVYPVLNKDERAYLLKALRTIKRHAEFIGYQNDVVQQYNHFMFPNGDGKTTEWNIETLNQLDIFHNKLQSLYQEQIALYREWQGVKPPASFGAFHTGWAGVLYAAAAGADMNVANSRVRVPGPKYDLVEEDLNQLRQQQKQTEGHIALFSQSYLALLAALDPDDWRLITLEAQWPGIEEIVNVATPPAPTESKPATEP